jgi:chromosome segregation ATPase
MLERLFNRHPKLKVEKIEKEVTGFLSELNWIKAQLEEKEISIDHKNKICDEKKSLIISTEALITQAKENLRAKKQKSKQLKIQHDQLQLDLIDLTKKLEKEEEIEKKVNLQLTKKNEDLDEIREHIQIRQNEFQLKGKQREALENELSELQDKIGLTQNLIDQMSQQERNLLLEIKKLEDKRGRVRVTLLAKDEKSEDLKRKIESLQTKIEAYQNEFSQKNSEYQLVAHDQQSIEETIESNLSLIAQLEQQIHQLKIQIAEKQKEGECSQLLLDEQNQELLTLETQIRDLEFELQTKRSNQLRLQESQENLGFKVRKMQSIKNELQNEIKAFLQHEKTLQFEDNNLSDEMEFLKNDIAKLEQRLSEKLEIKQTVNQQLSELAQDHRELVKKRDHLIQTGHELEQLNHRNRKLIEKIQDNIGIRAQEITAIDQDLIHLNSEKERLESELNLLKGESQQYQVQMQSKLSQLAELTEVINLKQSELTKLQNQTKTARKEYEDNFNNVESIKIEIIECQNKISQIQSLQNDEVQLIQNYELTLAQQVESKNIELARLRSLNKSLEQGRKQLEFARRSCQELESINGYLQAEVNSVNQQYHAVLTELRSMDKILGDIKQKRSLLIGERDNLSQQLTSAASILERSRKINSQIQEDLNATGIEIEKSKSELSSVAVQIENLQKKEQTLTKLLNLKDEDLNSLHLKINLLKQEEKQTLGIIKDLEQQSRDMEDLISKMSQEEKTLEDSRGRLSRILNATQKRFEDLKSSYQQMSQNIEDSKVITKNNIEHIKQQKNAIMQLEQKIQIENKIQPAVVTDTIDKSVVAQHINAISDFCLSTKIDLDFSEAWVDSIQGDDDGTILYHSISMYGKALKVLGAKRMELAISRLEQFGDQHFVLSFVPDNISNMTGIKDVFSKASQIIKTRSEKLNPKLAHKAKVENGKLEKIDIIVKFNQSNQIVSQKKDHHPWRSSTSSLM